MKEIKIKCFTIKVYLKEIKYDYIRIPEITKYTCLIYYNWQKSQKSKSESKRILLNKISLCLWQLKQEEG